MEVVASCEKEAVKESEGSMSEEYSIKEMCVAFADALTPSIEDMLRAMTEIAIHMEEAAMDNAYHPTGKVVQGSATPVIDANYLIEPPKSDQQ